MIEVGCRDGRLGKTVREMLNREFNKIKSTLIQGVTGLPPYIHVHFGEEPQRFKLILKISGDEITGEGGDCEVIVLIQEEIETIIKRDNIHYLMIKGALDSLEVVNAFEPLVYKILSRLLKSLNKDLELLLS